MSKVIHVIAQDASFPLVTNWKGVKWSHTGKKGKDRSTGQESWEYAELNKEGEPTGRRIWQREDGTVTPD